MENVATLTTVAIAWWVTGNWQVGVQVGVIEVFAKLALYYLHERFWYKFIGFGVVVAQPERDLESVAGCLRRIRAH